MMIPPFWIGEYAQNCQQNPENSDCQKACRCACDEYWNTDTFCTDICASINNGSPVDEFSWCSNYNVADACDQYGSNWSDSTIQNNLNIKYMRAYGRDFKLNFFTDTARDVDELLPLAIVIHGGGYNSGSKDNCEIIESAREFASRGYRTIAISYPLCGAYWNGTDVDEDVAPFGSGPWHAWDAKEPLYPLGIGQQHPQCEKSPSSRKVHPEQYKQAQEVANRAARYAVRYAHNRAEEWGIDVDRTICNGVSAGAFTCYEMFLFNTTVRFKPENTGLEPEPALDQIKINVAAGRAGGLLEIRAVTYETVAAMTPGAAVYDLHGDNDVVVPIHRAEFLVETMEEFGIPAVLDIVPSDFLTHSLFWWQFNKSHPERLDAMFDFIEKYLPERGTPSPNVTTQVPMVTPSIVPAPTDEVAVHPYKPFTEGANALFIGNSFFIPVSKQFDEFATSAQSQCAFFPQHGFETESSGDQSGSPGQLWNNIGHRAAIDAKLSSGIVDLFGMTNFDEFTGYFFPSAEKFIPDYTRWIDLALSYNPSTAIFLGWHYKTYNYLYFTEQFKIYDEFLCNSFYNTVVSELRRLYPETQFLYICYGPVASTMRQMFQDGNLTDIKNKVGPKETSLFTDDAARGGHAGEMMIDMMGMIWLQILYDPPSRFLYQYMNRDTPWDKDNVRDIITEGLEFNEKYNLKADNNNIFSKPTNVPTTLPLTIAPVTMQPSLEISSSPSMVPTTSPTLGIGLCFPSESIVQVLRGNKKRNIPMEQLQIDDYVMTSIKSSSPSYERVYNFGHYHPDLSKVQYLRFLPSGLELSANHYVYRVTKEGTIGKGKFVPAREIKVGDELVLISTAITRHEKVTGINYVSRRGALAPLTSSGTIVVNGVLASTYALEDEFLLPSWIENQFQEWAHFVTVILRYNSWIGGAKKEEQHTTAEGLSTSTDQLRKMTIWFFQQSSTVQVLLAICLLPSFSLMYSLEQTYIYLLTLSGS